MNSNTFQSVALNEIYTSVFDELTEEFLVERYDENFDFEDWFDEQLLWKTNSEGVGNDYLNFINHLRTAEVMELLGEVNEEVVEASGENLAMKFDTTFVATMAVWAVGHRIRTNNSNPLDNEFTRMNPAEPPSDSEDDEE
jgi:hypothetical protein